MRQQEWAGQALRESSVRLCPEGLREVEWWKQDHLLNPLEAWGKGERGIQTRVKNSNAWGQRPVWAKEEYPESMACREHRHSPKGSATRLGGLGWLVTHGNERLFNGREKIYIMTLFAWFLRQTLGGHLAGFCRNTTFPQWMVRLAAENNYSDVGSAQISWPQPLPACHGGHPVNQTHWDWLASFWPPLQTDTWGIFPHEREG